MEKNHGRKKEPEINRQLIIEAATDIGAASDWHQVTFQSIADKTGLSKGGIIHHFRNKDELLDELMSQSLQDLTTWVERYKSENGQHDGALAYLEFIMSKRDDSSYRKTMRIVLQAILINEKYNQSWSAWYSQHIMPESKEISVQSMITLLVADGIWYNEHMGTRQLDNVDKDRIFAFLKKI